jgi:hypothetical protein
LGWDRTNPRGDYKPLDLPNLTPEERMPPQYSGDPHFGFLPEGIHPEWIPPIIRKSKSVASTSFISIMNLHADIGGIMLGFGSPSAPVFWCFHGFVVQLYKNWTKYKR